jgi:hypothetical protein
MLCLLCSTVPACCSHLGPQARGEDYLAWELLYPGSIIPIGILCFSQHGLHLASPSFFLKAVKEAEATSRRTDTTSTGQRASRALLKEVCSLWSGSGSDCTARMAQHSLSLRSNLLLESRSPNINFTAPDELDDVDAPGVHEGPHDVMSSVPDGLADCDVHDGLEDFDVCGGLDDCDAVVYMMDCDDLGDCDVHVDLDDSDVQGV